MSNKMLPSGISIRIRENLIEGSSRTQTTLIIDPIITLSGDRVLMTDIGDKGYGKIDQGNSREELISWTGITDNTTTYTLTGVVWGVNFHNLIGGVSANMKRHNSGAVFSINTDMHYIAEQFVSSDDFSIVDNSLEWGDGLDNDKTIYAKNGDTDKPFIRYDASENKFLISNDGINTFDPEAGGSGLTAGHGIDINGGAIDVDLSELTTDTALDVSSGQIVVKFDESTLVENSANGIKNVLIQGDTQAAGYLTGGTSPSALSIFQSLGNDANNGKFKINVDGTQYDNVGIDLALTAESPKIIQDAYQGNSGGQAGVWNSNLVAQSFSPTTDLLFTKLGIKATNFNYPVGNIICDLYLADVNNKPTGPILQSSSIPANSITNTDYYYFNFNYFLTANTKYVIVFSLPGTNSSNYINLWLQPTNVYANGTYLTSSNSGSTWTEDTKDFAFRILGKTGNSSSFTLLAAALQSAIRNATGSTETVTYDTDHFLITSSTANRSSQILKLMTPSTGTDISGSGATPYLDLGTNAVETLGTGDDNSLVKTDSNGKVSTAYLTDIIPATIISTGGNQVTSGRALNTVYQNTTGRPKLVIVSVRQQSAIGSGTVYVYTKIGATSTPSITTSTYYMTESGSSTADSIPHTLVVPVGYYYTVSTVNGYSGSPSLTSWFECDLV